MFEQAADEAEALAKRCFPILAGHDRMVQGAALAELVAHHIAGHVILGDRGKTEALRAMLLKEYIKAVEGLIPILDEDVIQPEIARRAQ
jgi:hypothetical protein